MDHETLRTILQHMDVKGKTLVLMLASSGMRIRERLQIRLEDINLETDPAEIVIRGENTKTEEQRDVFISREAKQMLKEWLKVRESYPSLQGTETKDWWRKE
ncbi:MAG TPA: site-specific integrase [Archaeoglobaceae archaeon]|nr:site-specific integrase [Archaeoglobaceae archaeon]